MRGNSSFVGRDVVVSAAITLVTAACAIACGLTADFSGLQSGTRDAGTIADVGADAPVDTVAAEASPAVDASTDGGGFCASLPAPVKFCDDFDEDQAIGAGWSSTDVYQGQSVSIDFTYYSPPASFLSSIDAANAPASARLQEDLPIGTPHVHVAFELLLPQVTGNFEICTLHEPVADGTTYGVFYKYQDGNLLVFMRTLDGDGGVDSVVDMIGPPPATWLHVEIDVDVSATGSIVVKHDGVVVASNPTANTATATRAAMFVELGYYSADPATAIAHFDDVIVDWQ
jgi:hypothetical protein